MHSFDLAVLAIAESLTGVVSQNILTTRSNSLKCRHRRRLSQNCRHANTKIQISERVVAAAGISAYTQNREKISKQNDMQVICPPHLSNVANVACIFQKSFVHNKA